MLLGQEVHGAAPVVLLKVPAKHAVGVLLSGPVKPLSASHAVAPVAPPVPLLDGQSVHIASPVASLNVSASQCVHDPGEPVEPAGHDAMQSSSEFDPEGLWGLPAGQLTQAADD